MIGATGRLYLAGSEADVRQAAEAAEDALVVRGDEPKSPPDPPRGQEPDMTEPRGTA